MDLNKYINQAAAQGPDMSKSNASSGSGGDYQPPAPGPALARFVGYIEIGQRKDTYGGETKIKDKVKLIFELHGSKYKDNPRITITETLSYFEKANFKKLFLAMRDGDESITHMAQLLGKPFKVRVFNKDFTGNDGKKKVFARLRDDNGYHIGPPVHEDPVSGDVTYLEVPEAVTKPKLFLWRFADQEMWDNLYIEGSYNDGRTKNLLQEEIKSALNFEGSPIHTIINGGSGLIAAADEEDLSPPRRGSTFRPQRMSTQGDSSSIDALFDPLA